MRVKYGFRIVIGGFVLVGFGLALSVWKWSAATDVSSVLGLITGVVGTVVGAFFGVQIGSQGKEKVEVARKSAENRALHLAAALGPKAEEVLKTLES
jgi:hypothetical protein